MSTAPCPDPNEGNEELFKAVESAFSESSTFLDEDGNPRELEFLNPDVIDMQVARFRERLESAPSAADPYA